MEQILGHNGISPPIVRPRRRYKRSTRPLRVHISVRLQWVLVCIYCLLFFLYRRFFWNVVGPHLRQSYLGQFCLPYNFFSLIDLSSAQEFNHPFGRALCNVEL